MSRFSSCLYPLQRFLLPQHRSDLEGAGGVGETRQGGPEGPEDLTAFEMAVLNKLEQSSLKMIFFPLFLGDSFEYFP